MRNGRKIMSGDRSGARGVEPDRAARVLVAGCGYVGCALAGRLALEGHEVWGLRRRPDELPEGVRPLAADLTDGDSLSVLPDALDVVFYTTAPAGRGEAAYRAAYVEGLRNLLATLAAADRPPRRVFLTTSTGVYGQSEGEWVDETSPTRPSRATAEILLEAERLLGDGPLPGTAVRLGGIYGPGRERRIRLVREGEAECPADGPVYSNRIHRDDCAGVLHHLMTLDAPADVYVAVDREPAPLCTVYRWLAERLGAPEPPVAERSRRRGSKRCSSDRLVASGYAFRYPTFREGYEAIIAGDG